MEKTVVKTAKMAMEADANIIGDSFIVQPDKALAAKLGVMFGIVEIYSSSDSFCYAFMEAIADLKTEYYLPPFASQSLEKRFEEALFRTNRRLNEAVNQSVEEVDLRNTSAVLGIVHDGKVFISATGSIKGFFFRRKKNGELMAVDILGEAAEKRFRPEPSKLFANIISGEITARDTMMFVNEEFLSLYAINDLGEIAVENNAPEIIKELEHSLKEKVARKNFYAIALRPDLPPPEKAAPEKPLAEKPALPQEAVPLAAAAYRPATKPAAAPVEQARQHPDSSIPNRPQKSLEKLLFTQVKTEKYLTPSMMPSWQKVILIIWRKAKALALASADWLKNNSKNALGKLKKDGSAESPAVATVNMADQAPKQPQRPAEWEPTEDGQPAEIPPAESCSPNPEALTAEQSDDFEIDTSVPAEEIRADLAQPAGPQIREGIISGRINGFMNGSIAKFINFTKGQQIALALVFLMIFIFSQSIVLIGRSYDKQIPVISGSEQTIKKINELLTSAEAQSIYNDDKNALASLISAKELLSELPNKKSAQATKNDLAEKVQTALNKLKRLTIIPTSTLPIADFASGSSNQIGLGRIGNNFWSFDNTSLSLLRFNNGQLETVTTSLPQLKRLSALDSKTLLAYTDAGSYFKFNLNTKAAAKYKPASNPFQLKSLPSSPLIDGPFTPTTTAMSLISETYTFVLTNGTTTFAVFDKAGKLVHQYQSPLLNGATAFAVSVKDKKAWLYNYGKVYAIDLIF